MCFFSVPGARSAKRNFAAAAHDLKFFKLTEACNIIVHDPSFSTACFLSHKKKTAKKGQAKRTKK
jgi:hypothetical protein